MEQILLNGIKVDELLEKIGQLIDDKISGKINHTLSYNKSNPISRKQVSEMVKFPCRP
jgi:hypothetical protein